MISDFILGLRDPSLMFEKTLLVADKLEEKLEKTLKTAYWWLRIALLTTLVAIVFAIALVIVLASGVSSQFVIIFLAVICGLLSLISMVMLLPVLMIAQTALDQVPQIKESLKKWPRAIGSAAFLLLFVLFSYWKFSAVFSPQTAAALLFIIMVSGLGCAVGWIAIPTRLIKAAITSQLLVYAALIIVLSAFPNVLPAAARLWRHQERNVGWGMEDRTLHPVKIDPAAPPHFFGSNGEARYGYTQDGNATYRVFTSDVIYDPDTRKKVIPIDSVEKRDEILRQIRNDSELAKAKAELDRFQNSPPARTVSGPPQVSGSGFSDGASTGPENASTEAAEPLPKRVAPRSHDEAMSLPLATLWYSKNERGEIELFDRSGVHPQLMIKLSPMTPEIAREVRQRFNETVWPAK